MKLSTTEMKILPHIELDTTLAELYAGGITRSEYKRIALVLGGVSSEIALSSKLARNSKFLYQERVLTTTPRGISSEQYKEIQRVAAVKYLALLPQRDAFAAGNMPVFLVNLDGSEARSKEEAKRTTCILKQHQRPELFVAESLNQIASEAKNVDLFSSKLALDGLEGLPLTVELDTHYFLNSKAALCASGLPSPKSLLLELDSISGDPKLCCKACRQASGNFLIPESCTGIRGHWLKTQITRTLSHLSSQQLPFVLKSQQTFGGAGTWVITTEGELRELKAALSTLILPKLFSQVNLYNAYLKPATLILSEMIRDPISDWGLSFFVTKAGECIFLAVTQQILSSANSWIGSTVTYAAQASLKEKFTPIMHQIGAWLHRHDYYGPCGADILETAPTHDSQSNLHIVDLNVRTAGSLVLGLMKGHFSERRGLHEASSFSIHVNMTREAFIARLADLFRAGAIVIISWYEDGEAARGSSGVLVIGARNKLELEKRVAMVKELGSEIHY